MFKFDTFSLQFGQPYGLYQCYDSNVRKAVTDIAFCCYFRCDVVTAVRQILRANLLCLR